METIKTAGATSFDCEGRLGIAGWIVDVFRWDPCYETGVYGIRYTRLTELLTSRRVPVQNSERTVSQSGYSHPSREREREGDIMEQFKPLSWCRWIDDEDDN